MVQEDRADPRPSLGLGGGSDAEVSLWPRLVIALLVLDQPVVLGGRVIEYPEGIARRAHPGLRFAPPAQVPVPLGCLLDGQLGQRERLQPLVGNGSTGQDRGSVGARSQAGLGPFQGGPPVIQPLAQGLAGLLGDPAVGAVRLVLWAGGGDRVVVVAGHCPTQLLESATLLVQQGSRPRLVHPSSSSATWPADCLLVGQCPTGRHGGCWSVSSGKLLGHGDRHRALPPRTEFGGAYWLGRPGSPDATAPGPGRGIGSDLRFQLYEASDLAAVDPEVPFDVGRQPPGDGGYVDACSSTTLVRFSRHVASPAISC